MKYKIVTDRKVLNKKCKPCKNVAEGIDIGKTLLDFLSSTDGVGLAANQIGINKKVCVINVTKPIILINPVIVGKFDKIKFMEGCLSFPGDYIVTERYANILVDSENYSKSLMFDIEENALECVCVQHEIDHLNGLTMHDRLAKEAYRGTEEA